MELSGMRPEQGAPNLHRFPQRALIRNGSVEGGVLEYEDGADESADRLEPLLLRAAEVAQLLAIGRSKVYEMMSTGELPTVRIGTAVRVPAKALEEWVVQQAKA
jgi:excisionase family DNA binding protein